jgi:hypothetical protein
MITWFLQKKSYKSSLFSGKFLTILSQFVAEILATRQALDQLDTWVSSLSNGSNSRAEMSLVLISLFTHSAISEQTISGV